MNTSIVCFFCFKTFDIFLDESNATNVDIFDCEICCNPNKIQYTLREGILTIYEISNGNE